MRRRERRVCKGKTLFEQANILKYYRVSYICTFVKSFSPLGNCVVREKSDTMRCAYRYAFSNEGTSFSAVFAYLKY